MFNRDISYRARLSLDEYYAFCAKCPFKDMKAACIRAQKLKTMICYRVEPKDI